MRDWFFFSLRLFCFGVPVFLTCAHALPAYRQAPVLRYESPGQFCVRLVGIPGTGYRWHFLADRSPDLVLLSQSANKKRVAQRRVGAPEVRTFLFGFKQGVRPYPVALQFVYGRPFEGNVPAAKQVVWAYLAD
jgi:predicted secreted protein